MGNHSGFFVAWRVVTRYHDTMAYDHPDLYPDVPERISVAPAYPRLKPVEKAFVDAYVSHLGASARSAGKAITEVLGTQVDNSERANAMLAKPHVKRAINERARQIAAKFNVDGNSVVKEVANIAFANMANYLHITEGDDPYIDLSKCTFDQLAAIQEVTVEDYTDGRGDDAREVKRIKIKLHPKLEALEKLMKYLQLYAPERIDVNVTSTNVNVNMTPQEAAELYAQSLRKVGG